MTYVWNPLDLWAPGIYECEWEVTFADGSVQTSDPPFLIAVRAQLG